MKFTTTIAKIESQLLKLYKIVSFSERNILMSLLYRLCILIWTTKVAMLECHYSLEGRRRVPLP